MYEDFIVSACLLGWKKIKEILYGIGCWFPASHIQSVGKMAHNYNRNR
jgi:hypothetical protein